MYECVCYPHTPDADFEVVLPDGCRESMWTHVDETMHDHSFLIFAISLRLDHMLIDENRHADIFPESARQDRLEEEAFEAKRAEYRRTHPDASKQSMKVTLTVPSRRSESSEAIEPGNGEAKKAPRKELSGNTRKAPVREPFSIWSGQRDSNPRSQPWQGCALPTKLCPQRIPAVRSTNSVGDVGIEPTTLSVSGKCASRCANRPKRVSAYATFGGNAKSSACRQREVGAGKCRGIGMWDVEPALRKARGCRTHAVACRTS